MKIVRSRTGIIAVGAVALLGALQSGAGASLAAISGPVREVGNLTLFPPPPSPAVSLSPATIDFGSVGLGEGGGNYFVTLTNSGKADADISSTSFTGPDASDFFFGPITGPPATDVPGQPPSPPAGPVVCGKTVAAGASCTLGDVNFAPTAVGSRTAALTVAGNFPSASLPLSGTGTEGYWILSAGGRVTTFGDARSYGDEWPTAETPNIAIASTEDNGGYYLASSTGQVRAYGNAQNEGSLGRSNDPIVGIAPDYSDGYWLVSSGGGVFTFGDAGFFGSAGAMHLNRPIVGMASTPDDQGYWLVASDGGIFTFGDANFYGSTGALHLNEPIVGMASTPDGKGYWLVAADGGIFTFGDADFYGSTGGIRLDQPIVGMTSTSDGHGYWLVAADGGVFSFGDAPFLGSAADQGIADVTGIVLDGGHTG
jgi:hypothetical protein